MENILRQHYEQYISLIPLKQTALSYRDWLFINREIILKQYLSSNVL